MTTKQENRLSMYLPVDNYCDANTAITASLPNFSTNAAALKSAIASIKSFSEVQKVDRSGATTNKSNAGSQLIVIAADNARKLTAYAKFTNNSILLSEVNISEGKFKNFADTELRDYAQIIYNRAQTNVTALAAYGITAATQTAFAAAIKAYSDSLALPRVSETTKVQATKQLELAFKAADTALRNMDTAVEIIRLSQPNFYKGYKTARKIVELGSSTMALKGLITDALTGAPVKGVNVCLALDNSMMKAAANIPTEQIVKKTAEKGGFNIKSLPAGMYNVTVKKNGYAEQVMQIAVSDGEMTDLKIQISKN
jgi:hypothetical protein